MHLHLGHCTWAISYAVFQDEGVKCKTLAAVDVEKCLAVVGAEDELLDLL